jgi:uncharacterized membrane protein YdjX (TVP38/TMEM64 family)
VRYRRLLTYAWIAVVLSFCGWYFARPEHFTPESFQRLLTGWGAWAFPGFVLVSIVRGLVLVPSTPIVIAGGLFFPEALPAVLIVSMVGIIVSASLLYRFPGFAGYDRVLAEKYPAKLQHLREKLGRPGAIWFVAAWAFFPVVPTDLICYAAGLVRMPYNRMIAGIILGELPLVSLYVLAGAKLSGFLPT